MVKCEEERDWKTIFKTGKKEERNSLIAWDSSVKALVYNATLDVLGLLAVWEIQHVSNR
jgi:hypothetical protein